MNGPIRIYTLSRPMGSESIVLELDGKKLQTIDEQRYKNMKYCVDEFLRKNGIKEERYLSDNIFYGLMSRNPKKLTVVYGSDPEKGGKTDLPKDPLEHFC